MRCPPASSSSQGGLTSGTGSLVCLGPLWSFEFFSRAHAADHLTQEFSVLGAMGLTDPEAPVMKLYCRERVWPSLWAPRTLPGVVA